MITYARARIYVDRGWPVFPVALSLDKDGKVQKKPIVPWREYQERLPTDKELHQWFDSEKVNGIGLATGKLPRVVVVDADTIVDSISSPLVVKTISGGRHYYFRWTKELRNEAKIEGQPLDIRGDGGFVVLPPSSLGARAYEWEKEIDPMFLNPLPDEILKKLSVKSPISEYKPAMKQGDDLPFATEGERNHVATQVAGILVAGMNPKLLDTAGWSAFQDWNCTHVTPPLDERELRVTWESIVLTDARNYPKARRDQKSVANFQNENSALVPTKEAILKSRQLLRQSPGTYDLSTIERVLSQTIKHDDVNKKITFLTMLSAYTESDQTNLAFSSPSSTGKSYLALETAKLFPEEDVITLGYASPTAFFHDRGIWDDDRKAKVLDMSRKIYLFLDMPHYDLLARLRPFLSHDKKEITFKTTNQTKKFGLRAEDAILVGYPVVVFASANQSFDEQESTRCFFLSADTDDEKLNASIKERILYETDRDKYKKSLEDNPERKALKEYIVLLKNAQVNQIIINNPKLLEELFFDAVHGQLKSRHARDISRVASLIKSISLLKLGGIGGIKNNGDFTMGYKNDIHTMDEDIREGIDLWKVIAEPQELSISPYTFDIYKRILLPLHAENVGGFKRTDIIKRYTEVYHKPLPEYILRRQILPMLEGAGLIYEEIGDDRRTKVVRCISLGTTPSSQLLSVISKEDIGANEQSKLESKITDEKMMPTDEMVEGGETL